MTESDPEPEHVAQVRAGYDATAEVYADLVGTEVSSTFEAPLDRALLASYVESVTATGAGPVADLGCGPGRVTAFLARRGLEVIGIDVSTAMVDVARRSHPSIRFEEGRLSALPFADASLAGTVCWYSIIHTPPDGLGVVCDELARVLAPGGHLLVAFQAGGGDRVERADVGGSGVSMTNYRHDPDRVREHLAAAGLGIEAQASREPLLAHETTRQAFLLARARS